MERVYLPDDVVEQIESAVRDKSLEISVDVHGWILLKAGAELVTLMPESAIVDCRGDPAKA